jgi:hypothetical protein
MGLNKLDRIYGAEPIGKVADIIIIDDNDNRSCGAEP